MVKNPKISIATVCLNAASSIEKTVQSVLAQKYENIEYIIQDGCSTDGTLEILSHYHDRVKVFSEKDTGIYDAMNKAKAKATGDFLLFLGADDLLYNENVISDVVTKLKAGVVNYGNVKYNDNGKIFDGRFTKWKWGYENICHQSIFYPKSIYQKYDYDKQYKLVADWAYNLVLMRDGVDFDYVDIVVAEYNRVGVSSTNNDKTFLAVRRKLTIDAVGLMPYLYGLVHKAWRRLF